MELKAPVCCDEPAGGHVASIHFSRSVSVRKRVPASKAVSHWKDVINPFPISQN